MKRILYSCLLFVSFLITNTVNGQAGSFSMTPQFQCYNATNSYSVQAATIATINSTTSHSWTVLTGQAGCTPTITSLNPLATPANTTVDIVIPCCGQFTIICEAYNGATPIATLALAFQPIPNTPGIGQIYCQSGAAITPSLQTICVGSQATLAGVAAPGTTYTWSPGNSNANPIIVSPTVNTCYTYTATTPQGCTITPAAPACVNVQSSTLSVSPLSQTMCLGSPVTFTAFANATSNASVSPGTTITGYQWYYSFPTPAPGAPTTNSVYTHAGTFGGTYDVVVTHTGAAGTCTLIQTANVTLGTNITVSISPTSPSVCPGGSITLTAVSQQTATTTNFTWTTSDNGAPPVVQTGNGISIGLTGINPITTVTVDVDYFSCPGQATTTIGLLTLNPTLTASSGTSSCPGQSLTLTAKGGLSYTFTAIPPFPTPTSTLTNATFSTAPHTPGLGDFPIQYCVNADSAGCVGSACIVVTTRTLTPTLTVSATNSICPGTQFTLTAGGSGVHAGATYTFIAPYLANIGNTNPTPHTATGTNSNGVHTYSVVVDSAGCQGQAQVTVNFLTLQPLLTSSSPSICANTQLTLTASNVGAGTTYTFLSSHTPTLINNGTPTTNVVEHTPPTATLVTYTVTADSAGCRGVATHSIGLLDLGPLLSLSLTPASNSVCPSSTIIVRATGASNYSFTSPSPSGTVHIVGPMPTKTTVATSPTFQIPSTIPLTGITYTVYADSAGCVGNTTITAFEFKLNPSISSSSVLLCSNQEVTLTAGNVNPNSAPFPGGPVSYTFYSTFPPTSTSTISSSVGSFSATHQPTIQTIYSVLADSAGCTTANPGTITVNIKPDLFLIPSATATSVCPGLRSELNVTSTAPTNITYTWTQPPASTGSMQPNSPTSVAQTVSVYPVANTTYTVYALDNEGCVGDTVITVNIDPNISFSIGLSTSGSTICAGQSVTLSATSTVVSQSYPGNVITYTWLPSGINPTNAIIASPSVTTIYTVTAGNGYNCFATNTITVPVGTYPSISIAASAYSVCAGFTSTLTGQGANSYTWTSTTLTVAQQSIAVTPGTYSLVGSNGGGCISNTFITIGSQNNLSITIVAQSLTTCIANNSPKFSQPVNLSASGAATYVWFPYNPLHMTYSLGPTTDVRPPATTQYTVVGSTQYCAGQQTIQITVIPQFTFGVVEPMPAICLGDSINLNIVNVGALAVGPVSAFTYSWTEALNAPPISMSSYFSPTVTVFPQNTTTYSVEVSDSRDCISFPKLVTVTVLPRPITAISIPTINNVPTNTVCFVGLNPGALDVTLNLTGNNMNPGLPFGVIPTYTWISPYAPMYNSILTPTYANAIIINAPIRVFNGSSIATYTLISGYQGPKGCKRIDTVSIRVVDCRPVYSVSFTTAEANDTICARNCITYVNQSDTMSGGPQIYKWQFFGGSPATSTLANPTVCYNFPGKHSVVLQVSNPYPIINPNGGAPGSTGHLGVLNYVKVVDVPNVTIIAPGQQQSDTTIRFGQAVSLKGTGALTYEWSPAYNISSITKPNVTVNPMRTTQYVLTGYNSKKCASSDTLNVIVVEDCGEMYVPNAFTPNNDGANDVLYVRGICLQSLTFMVFNRWGEKVFETADQSKGWDGSYKGQELNTGVFVYRLEGKTYDGKGFSSKGNITLIR